MYGIGKSSNVKVVGSICMALISSFKVYIRKGQNRTGNPVG